MGRTKIIEIYGLPGSGKTTCCTCLRDVFKVKNAALLLDTLRYFKWYYVLRIFSSRKFFLFLRSIPILKLVHKVPLVFLFSPYKKSLMFDCIKHFSDYDVVFVDHGVIQSYVSALYEDISNIDDYRSQIGSFLQNVNEDVIVYLQVSPETAVGRIKERHNKNKCGSEKIGRLEKMKDDEMLRALHRQWTLFESLTKISEKNSFAKIVRINAEESPERVEKEVMKALCSLLRN